MTAKHHIVLAPITLKPGIGEPDLIAASDAFERNFASSQGGIVSRQLLRRKDGGFADLVIFESKEAAERVMEAEMNSPHCMEFFSIMEIPEGVSPDDSLMRYDLIKKYK